MTLRVRLIVLPLAAALLPVVSYAQVSPPPAGQPPVQPRAGSAGQALRPIFGGGAARIAQSLTLGLSLGETFFRTHAEASVSEPARRDDSAFLYGSGDLTYVVDGSRAGATVMAASTGQYYSELSDEIMRGYVGRVGGWLRFSARTRLTVEQEASYLPAFQGAFRHLIDPTGGLLNEPASDVSASDERWLSYDTRVGLSHMLSRRATLLIDYSRHQLNDESEQLEQRQHQAGFRYTYQLGAGLGLRAGYRYSTSRAARSSSESASTPALHSIDAGVDFNRAFSVSRRTTLGVRSGSAVVTDQSQTRFFVIGNGTLSHQMFRTWTAMLDAGRNVDFADGFREPVVSDRATASLSGTLGRRVQSYTFVSAVRGREALTGAGDAFVTYQGGTNVAVGLSRHVTWTSGFVRQESDFGDADFLVSPELRTYESISSGVSVALWRYLSLHTNYAYTTVDRAGAIDTASPPFRRHTVSISLSTMLPFYATVRK